MNLYSLITLLVLSISYSIANSVIDIEELPFNYFQSKGTHNSYHQKPMMRVTSQYNYDHLTLTEQLRDYGIRQLELDINVARKDKLKVNHVPYIDAKSSCKYLKDCLSEIKAYSDSTPDHFPIMIWIEPKINPMHIIHPGYKKFKLKHLLKAEKQIEQIIGLNNLIKPSDLKIGELTLADSIQEHGWPKLKEMRGKFIIILLNYEDMKTEYNQSTDKLDLIFTRTKDLNDENAAFFKEGNCNNIDRYIKKNYIFTGKSEGAQDEIEDAKANIKKCIKNGVHVLSGDRPTDLELRDAYFTKEAIVNQRVLEILGQ